MVSFRILGPIECYRGERRCDLGGPRQLALLAALLLHANRSVSVNWLIEALWGEQNPAGAGKRLQMTVARLRKALNADGEHAEADAVLRTVTSGYLLTVAPGQVDAEIFEALLQKGQRALDAGDAAYAAAALREALGCWHGPALAEVAHADFAQAEIRRLEELRLAALEARVEADLQLGRHAAVAGELDVLVAEHRLRERLHAQRMLALYRCGRQADALDAYHDARRILVGEIGIEPGPRLRHLQEAILRQDPALEPAASAAPGAGTPRSPFVGRVCELEELLARLEEAFAGRGRLVLLAGEPGIGKSRLMDEMVWHALSRGARVLMGRCWEAGGAPAYWPWVQALRAYVRDSEPAVLQAQLGEGAASVAQLLPELGRQLPEPAEQVPVEPEAARFRLFDATAEFLRNASAGRPIVLVVDDLHAADAPSLLLLRFLARQLGSIRMLVLAAYRDVDPSPGPTLTEALADLRREPVTSWVSLRGLSERELAEYVALTGRDIASPALVAALHEETEGNPFFAGEIVRLMSIEGLRSGSIADVRRAIPQSVREAIDRRLAHLSEACHRILVLAAVLGREFSLDTLAALAGVPEDRLVDPVDEAITAGVVSDIPGASGRVRFAHVLIRDTLFAGLSSARRIRLHREAASALEERYGDDPGPHLAELAHHCLAGRFTGKGVKYAQRAGDRALAQLAYEEAARLYESALEALAPSIPADATAPCELLLSLADARSRAGDSPGAKRALLEAADVARRLGLPRELGRAAAEYGGRIVFARAGDDERVVPLLEEALDALGQEDLELRVRLLARLAGALRDEHSRARRDALSREAVALARRSSSCEALAYALDGRAIAILAPDTIQEVEAIATELGELARRAGDRERLVHAHTHRIGPLLMLGRADEAAASLEVASRIAGDLRQPGHLWFVRAVQAMLALAEGRLEEAQALVDQARAHGARAQPDMAAPVHAVQRHTLCDFRGDLEDVEPAIHEHISRRPARPMFRCVLAQLHARIGRRSEAQRTLNDLADQDFSDLPFDQEWLYSMSLLSETAALLNDVDAAATLHRLLLPWAALSVVDQCEAIRGSLSRDLGVLATVTADLERAEEHFEDALAMDARMGFRPWHARAQDDYARMLVARNRRGDRQRADELLASALTTYRQLGLNSYARSASTVGQIAPGR